MFLVEHTLFIHLFSSWYCDFLQRAVLHSKQAPHVQQYWSLNIYIWGVRLSFPFLLDIWIAVGLIILSCCSFVTLWCAHASLISQRKRAGQAGVSRLWATLSKYSTNNYLLWRWSFIGWLGASLLVLDLLSRTSEVRCIFSDTDLTPQMHWRLHVTLMVRSQAEDEEKCAHYLKMPGNRQLTFQVLWNMYELCWTS